MTDASNLGRDASPSPAPSEPILSTPPTGPGRSAADRKKAQMGPVRQQLEAFGVAILAAVLLKWFCLEAFQIPTSSMQPTLMGDTAAGVYDRILVDKILPTFREPKRWDITVFKYPMQKNQNYVKRIGGMPNDRLTITGGNLWHVRDEGGKRSYEIVRKPDDLQEQMWKNVHPARMERRAEAKALGGALAASPQRAFTEDDAGIHVALEGSEARLYLRDDADGGMVDRVWDGYPAAVSRAIRDKNPFDQPQEIVPDVRIAANVTADQAIDLLAFEVVVSRPNVEQRTFALVVEKGQARLQVRGAGNKVEDQSEPFALALEPGTATELAFAHVDAELIAWRDGTVVGRFDVKANWQCRDGCVLPYTSPGGPTVAGKLELPANQRVVPQVTAKGKGALHLAALRIDRDQHYTRSTAPEIIEVPDGHYYMLGDNTLQSIDSRGWTAVTIGVDEHDNIVPSDTPGARIVRGNKRAMSLANPPDRDETPIPIPSEDAVVMIDEFGEVLRLNAKVSPSWPRVAFMARGAADARTEWEAQETTNAKGISFVPRSDIQGRALLVFYPVRPFSWLFGNAWPGRFGFVR